MNADHVRDHMTREDGVELYGGLLIMADQECICSLLSLVRDHIQCTRCQAKKLLDRVNAKYVGEGTDGLG